MSIPFFKENNLISKNFYLYLPSLTQIEQKNLREKIQNYGGVRINI
jgi:hypothetical protein